MKEKTFLRTALFVFFAVMIMGFTSCQTEESLTTSGLSSNGYHWIQNGDTYVVTFGEKSVTMENTTGYWVAISDADLKKIAEKFYYIPGYFTVMQKSAIPGKSIPDANTVVTNNWNNWLVGMSFTNDDSYNPTKTVVKMYKL